MADGDLRTEWIELGRIDYLLNALARAVERRDIPRSSYDALAPRYVARRAELVALLSGGARAEVPGEPAEIALDEVQGTVSRETPAPGVAPTYRCQHCSEPVNPGQRVCESCGTRIDWGALPRRSGRTHDR